MADSLNSAPPCGMERGSASPALHGRFIICCARPIHGGAAASGWRRRNIPTPRTRELYRWHRRSELNVLKPRRLQRLHNMEDRCCPCKGIYCSSILLAGHSNLKWMN